jgi:type IV pilus assembly protein PilW
LTLLELIIGLAISLVGLLAISGVLQGFNTQKRTTVGNSDAQVIGGVASYMIQRDLRRAGYGANSEPALGCSLHLTDPLGGPSPLRLDPVRIVAGATDQVTITHGQSRHGTYYATLNSKYNGDGAPFAVDNGYGFTAGDLLVVGPATVTEADGTPICGMYRVSAVPDAAHLSHAVGAYNSAAVNLLAFNAGAKVYSFGLSAPPNGTPAELPEQVTYAVNANKELTMSSRATNFAPVAIGEQIVMLRAYYCKDTLNAAASTINVCDQVIPTTPAAWRQVLAVRIAVVARSGAPDAAAVTAAPLQLWSSMKLPGGGVLAPVTMPLTDDETHYRYRVYDSLVPIRNLIWQVPN